MVNKYAGLINTFYKSRRAQNRGGVLMNFLLNVGLILTVINGGNPLLLIIYRSDYDSTHKLYFLI
jgi:hypothetical protein